MAWYSITIERTGPRDLTDTEAGQLLDALTDDHAGAVSHGHHRAGTTISVQAPTAAEAALAAEDTIDLAMKSTGIDPTDWTTQVLEVLTEEEQQRQLDRPAFPELVGVAEIAELLGVSRQRAGHLRKTAHGFPAPVAELRSGPVWRRADLDRFLDTWERRPGRPAKTS